MFNGIDITETHNYIKINCRSYIDKFCEKYLNTWLNKVPTTENRPTPLPTDPAWVKKFNAAVGPTDPRDQQCLAEKMDIKYKAGVSKLILAMTMTTYWPDIAFTSVKLSQSKSNPAEHHFHCLEHAIQYVFSTRNDGIYFWCTHTQDKLPAGPLTYRQQQSLQSHA